MYIKKNVMWKIYQDESILYNLKEDSTLTLDTLSTKILMETIIYKNNIEKVIMNIQLENPTYDYNTLFTDVSECLDKIMNLGFITENFNDATCISLIGLYSELETASIEITNKCNLKCIHCYEGDHTFNTEEISLEDTKILIKKLKELGVISVVLTGGEPYLHDDLVEIVRLFNDANIRVTIFTNGQILNHTQLIDLSSMNVLIRISLEGITSEKNDYIRGTNSFINAMSFINACKEYNLQIAFSFTITKYNIGDFLELISFAEELGAYEIEASEIISINTNINLDFLLLSTEDLMELRHNYLKGFALSKPFRRGMGLYRKKKKNKYLCSAGTSNIFIDCKGHIYPCNLFASKAEYCIGNILKDDLLELWHASPVLKKMREIQKANIKECSSCNAIDNCNGGCRGRALLKNDDIYGQMDTKFCEVTRTLYNMMEARNE